MAGQDAEATVCHPLRDAGCGHGIASTAHADGKQFLNFFAEREVRSSRGLHARACCLEAQDMFLQCARCRKNCASEDTLRYFALDSVGHYCEGLERHPIAALLPERTIYIPAIFVDIVSALHAFLEGTARPA